MSIDLDSLDDRALVQRARNRADEALALEAFERLVERHRARVYGLALRMMRNPQDAEELLQETFLSAWQNLPDFRGDSAFSSWIHRICANFCLMRLRHRRVANEQPTDLQNGLEFSAHGTLLTPPSYDWSRGTEEKALDRELRRAIEQATESLPEDYRAVFLLKDIEGLSYEEIAQTLETTVPAIKSRLHRARLALRKAIDDFYREYAGAPAAVARAGKG